MDIQTIVSCFGTITGDGSLYMKIPYQSILQRALSEIISLWWWCFKIVRERPYRLKSYEIPDYFLPTACRMKTIIYYLSYIAIGWAVAWTFVKSTLTTLSKGGKYIVSIHTLSRRYQAVVLESTSGLVPTSIESENLAWTGIQYSKGTTFTCTSLVSTICIYCIYVLTINWSNHDSIPNWLKLTRFYVIRYSRKMHCYHYK